MNTLVKNEFSDMSNNPLLVNSVLEALFSFLDLENLKKCRYVCKTWKTEAFRAIRKCANVNLNTIRKQQSFLRSGVAGSFQKFSFNVGEWNETISSYLSLNYPDRLGAQVDLILHNDGEGSSFQSFEHLLASFADSIVELTVRIDCKSTEEVVIHDSLSPVPVRLSKLKTLAIQCGRSKPSVSWLQNLCAFLFRSSPGILHLDLRNLAEDNIWNEIASASNFRNLTELRYVHDQKTAIFGMHRQLLHNPFPASLKRLCIPFQESDSSLITNILARVAATLEILEFHTQDETALSPIVFPVMHRLTTLDAGSSQFSFPAIVSDHFPKLNELKATYWDWVYTREDLPDVHYYWRTNNPHAGIKTIHIRFPNWTDIDLQYAKLENFADFSEVIHSKFPTAVNFIFHNVSLCNDVRQGLEKFAEIFEFRYKIFRIASYNSSEIHNASPFEMNVSEDSKLQRELEVLDLCPKDWPAIWREKQRLLSTIRDEWLPVLIYFNNLRTLKVLWMKNLFSRLDLTNPNILPNLVHLEFIGNLCINRFERAAVRRSRPRLNIVQHRNCICESEDWWYINDDQSEKVFHNLFSLEPKGVKSFIKKILFNNLLM